MIFNVNNDINDIMTTTKPSLYNSCAGGLRINNIIGGIEQGENPSTDNPQPVNGSKISSIRVHKKNFLEITELTPSNSRGLSVEHLANGGVHIYGTHDGTDTFSYVLNDNLVMDKGDYIISGSPSGGGGSTHSIRTNGTNGTYDMGKGATFSLTEKTKLKPTIILAKSGYGGQTVDLTFYPMIRRVDIEDDTFETYQGKEISLSQPITLYNDVLGENVKRKYKKVVFDGSDDEKWRKGDTTESNRFLIAVSDGKANGNVLCTQSSNVAISSNLNLYMDNDFTTLEEWLSHLAENPMEVVYEIATPTTEELPTADRIALNSLPSYDGITYIEFVDCGVTPTANVTYGKSKAVAEAIQSHNKDTIAEINNITEINNTLTGNINELNNTVGQALYIVAFDSSTATLITKSADYEG